MSVLTLEFKQIVVRMFLRSMSLLVCFVSVAPGSWSSSSCSWILLINETDFSDWSYSSWSC
jgi:hypothetical protein